MGLLPVMGNYGSSHHFYVRKMVGITYSICLLDYGSIWVGSWAKTGQSMVLRLINLWINTFFLKKKIIKLILLNGFIKKIFLIKKIIRPRCVSPSYLNPQFTRVSIQMMICRLSLQMMICRLNSFHIKYVSQDRLLGKIILEEHIIKVCAMKLTFRIFAWKSYFHKQYYLKHCESCIYQIIKRRNIFEITFQLWALQVSWLSQPKIFSSILFDLQAFLVNEHLIDSNESVLRWKKISKKTLFFLSSLCLTKLSFLFSLFSAKGEFTSVCNKKKDYLPKTSHMRRENPNELIGLLWKAHQATIF